MEPTEIMQAFNETRSEVHALQTRLHDLERAAARQTAIPRTAILDSNFFTRAFAIWAHTVVAGLFIAVPVWAIMLFALIMAKLH